MKEDLDATCFENENDDQNPRPREIFQGLNGAEQEHSRFRDTKKWVRPAKVKNRRAAAKNSKKCNRKK